MARKNGIRTEQDLQGLFSEKAGLKQFLESALQKLIEEEADEHVGAGKYERNEDRRGYRNGKKNRRIKTRVGELELSIPQVRDSEEGPFQPSMLQRWQRSERALMIACAEMYFQGVSTRRVQSVLEKMGGMSLSAGQVSRVALDLDEDLSKLKKRRLSHTEYPYLIIDARYEKIRSNGHIVSKAVLTVLGVTLSGTREVLDWRVADSESEDTWSEVLQNLKDRGLQGVKLVVSDAHKGIRAALERHFQGILWQRCRVHFKRNILRKVSWKVHKQIMRELQAVFSGDDKEQTLLRAEEMAQRWERRYPRVSEKIRNEIEECLTVQDLPCEHSRKLKSTNMLERVMRDLKQRTSVVTIFPTASSCERLIGARLVELHEKWAVERTYLNMEHLYREEYREVLEPAETSV